MKREGIILAAGKGSRMPSQEIPKVMYKLDDRPMVSYLIDSFKQAKIEKPILVVGYKKEMIEEYFKDKVRYVLQKEQLGTGDAVKAAKDLFEGRLVPVLIAYGDMPFWSKETIEKMFDKYKKSKSKLVLATVNLPEGYPYGRIIRDDKGNLVEIVEEKDCDKEQLKIDEKNPGLYLVESQWLFKALGKIDSNNVQNEYYLTDIIEIAVSEGLGLETIDIVDKREAIGVNTKEDYQVAAKRIGDEELQN
jgi:bifunctional UDP-N-acetylglucosamine pyrophosphorylase/glucosamine-1-phosphate N-acetyltransferase